MVWQPPVDFAQIARFFSKAGKEYQSAEPFPHIAVNGLFDEKVLREVAGEFPNPSAMGNHYVGEVEGGKHTENEWTQFGPHTQAFIAACNSAPFLRALTALTGIEGLLSDPYLAGGGQHQTGRGGRLKVHSDFNVHPTLRLNRRLNMLVFLNDPWLPEWGGSLELWDQDMTRARVSVPPEMGYVAIFTCSDTSFHGLPDPIKCPDGVFRKSLAFYYFTADVDIPEPRSTLFKERPGEAFFRDISNGRPRMRASAQHLRSASQHLKSSISSLLSR